MKTRMLVANLLLVSVLGCLEQRPPANSPIPHIEDSVFPVYVVYGKETVETPEGRSTRSHNRACTGIFVAPNTMITSSTLFGTGMDSVESRGAVLLSDGDYIIESVETRALGKKSGIALIHTKERGIPVPLSDDAPFGSENVVAEGFTFAQGLQWQLMVPEWRMDSGINASGTIGTFPDAVFYVAQFDNDHAPCGAPVFDKRGRLAGIVYRRGGLPRESMIVAPSSIRAVLNMRSKQ